MTTYRNALPLGSLLLEYRLEAVLGAGGFGMTYLGRDTHLEKLVAIKEYLPTDLVVRALDGSILPITGELKGEFEWGLDRFIQEARTLARFSHPHIVRVNRYFQANGTGYMVMDYEKGESLFQMLKRGVQPDEAALKGILMPLLDGLQAVHSEGFLHRDIKPSNIFVRESGSPVLIDFGAARQSVSGATRSLTSVLTPGYAPLEQYSRDGHQGPWSDIYAMAGVIYRVLVSENPPDAVSRMKGDTVPGKLAAARGRVSGPFLRAVEWALALDEKERPQSVQEWKPALAGTTAAPDVAMLSLQSAPTVISSPPPSKPRPAEPAPGESRSGWRWVGIAAVLLLAVLAVSAWMKQRAAQTAAPGTARPAPKSAPAPEARAPMPGSKPGVAGQTTDPRDFSRARPERERTDRPGDVPRPALEEFRKKTTQEFKSGDFDGDGYLSREEVQSRFPGIAREFQRVDSDGDGRISPEEFWQLRRYQAQQKFRKQ
jgi:serine/threonine protein kinase